MPHTTPALTGLVGLGWDLWCLRTWGAETPPAWDCHWGASLAAWAATLALLVVWRLCCHAGSGCGGHYSR